MNAIAAQFSHRLRRLATAALALAGTAASLQAQYNGPSAIGIEAGVPVKITCDMSFTGIPSRGFAVAKISITNGTQGPLAWRAALVGNQPYYASRYRYGGSDDGVRSFKGESESDELQVPAGATREFNVALAAFGGGYRNLQIRGPHVNAQYAGHIPNLDNVLADRRLMGAFFDAWSETQKPTPSRGATSIPTLSPWSDFPEDWRAYSGFQLLLLQRTTWETLTDTQRGAICRVVALGGTLAFVPDDESPLPLPAEFGVVAQIGSKLPGVMYGLGSVDCLAVDPKACVSDAQALLKRCTPTNTMSWLNPLPDWLAAKLPRAALIVVLLLSAALAGPGALFWLAKRQQRHRLFIVLPAIAAGTTLVLLALIFLKDGTGGEGRRAVLAALVDGRPEMAVFQRQAARCGFLLRTDFALPEQALVEQHVPDKMAGDFTVGRKGAACRGDWFRNRSATVQTIVATVPTRAALELRRDPADGAPSVVSTFLAPLKDLFVFADGATWHAPLVQPGAPTPLLRLPEKPARVLFEHRSASVDGAIKWMFNGTDSNGRFLAATDRLEGAPLRTLDSIRWTDTIFVTGRVTEGGAR